MKRVVRLTQVEPDLSDVDDRQSQPAGNDGVGSFLDYDVPEHLQSESDELILDWFHNTIAIGCVDDFQWEVLYVP